MPRYDTALHNNLHSSCNLRNPHREKQVQQVLPFLQLVERGRSGGAHDVEDAARKVQHGRWPRGLQTRTTQKSVGFG